MYEWWLIPLNKIISATWTIALYYWKGVDDLIDFNKDKYDSMWYEFLVFRTSLNNHTYMHTDDSQSSYQSSPHHEFFKLYLWNKLDLYFKVIGCLCVRLSVMASLKNGLTNWAVTYVVIIFPMVWNWF